MSKARKAPVTARALIQRINRKLRPKNRMLKVTRGGRWRGDLGDYYLLDVNRNILLETHVDLSRLGKELEVLAAWEELAEEQD